jgi:hypothetical protein
VNSVVGTDYLAGLAKMLDSDAFPEDRRTFYWNGIEELENLFSLRCVLTTKEFERASKRLYAKAYREVKIIFNT